MTDQPEKRCELCTFAVPNTRYPQWGFCAAPVPFFLRHVDSLREIEMIEGENCLAFKRREI